MHKYCRFVLAVLLCFTSAAWAQRLPKPKKAPIPKIARQPIHPHFMRVQRYTNQSSAAVIAKRTELAMRLHRLIAQRQKNFLKNRAFTPSENSTIVGDVSKQNTPIRFRNSYLGMLKRGEHLVMGAAYDERGFQVTTLQYTLPNGVTPITVDKLDLALPGYGIKRIILMIQKKQNPGQETPTNRFIDYYLPTKE